MVRDGYSHLSRHLSYALQPQLNQEHATVFPSGEEELQPLTRSVMSVLPVGNMQTGVANTYNNSKTCFVTYKPVPLPNGAITRRALDFCAPAAANTDDITPTTGTLGIVGSGSYQGFTNNPSGTSPFVRKSRGVFTHVYIAYQGQLQSATGSLYIYIPPEGLFSPTVTTGHGGITFNRVFGETDTQVGSGFSNNNPNHPRHKKYTITLAKLAEVGHISFVIYNENSLDYVLQDCIDSPGDILNENVGNTTLDNYVNFICWCDSTTTTDRIRVHVNHHFDVIYNSAVTGFEVYHKTRSHIPPNHLSSVPNIVNSHHMVFDPTDAGAAMRLAHAMGTVSSMSQGQAMDQTGTGDVLLQGFSGSEMNVGKPSFSSVPRAAQAAWHTMENDEIQYGLAVAGEPALATLAPVVEPAIAGHGIYQFFKTNYS